MPGIVFPDYNNCILNTMSSFLKYYNAPCDYSSNLILDNFLSKHYKNIVFMIFDGMGADMLRKNLSEDKFLVKNISSEITSVFPCTTTAAMTSYYSGISPNEHGWLGWSLYFKEFNKIIDIFSNQDSFTKENAGYKHAAYTIMPYETVFEKINKSTSGETHIYTVMPSGIRFPEYPNKNIKVDSVEQICNNIKSICGGKQSNFIMSYWSEPDSSMHIHGCYTDHTKALVKMINSMTEHMCAGLKDTLVIISADHGLVDVDEEVYLNTVPEIDECLIMPPSIETRATSLFVKPEMKAVFEERFNNLFGDSFKLLKREDFMQNKLLGYGEPHKKINDFVGDYMACAIGHTMFRYKTANSVEKAKYKGQHAGLCVEEMMVPLIIIKCG